MSLTAENLESLKLARYELSLRAEDEALLPPFLGSTLRGALGHSLKAIACSVPHGDCGRCLLAERCLYPRLFETSARNSFSRNNDSALLRRKQDAPRPFILIPPSVVSEHGTLRARDDLLLRRVRVRSGDSIAVGLTLIGEAIDELPYLIYAISLMARRGLGAGRAPFVLELVSAVGPNNTRRVVFDNEVDHVIAHAECLTSLGRLVEMRLVELMRKAIPVSLAQAAETSRPVNAIAADRIPSRVTLRFLSPTRMRVKGRLEETPTFEQLVVSLSLRLAMLAETYATAPVVYDYKGMIELAREVETVDSSLRLMALDRFSNRQAAKLNLDGFMGDITFAGAATNDLLPMLVAGEFLNLGSSTAFGLGRYVVLQVD